MGGTTCAVYGCNNTYRTPKNNGNKVVFHSFPKAKDAVTNRIRNKWISRCNRAGRYFNPDTSRICSEHFVDDDYYRDLEHELLELPLRKRLKPRSVPSKGIVLTKEYVEDESKRKTSKLEGAFVNEDQNLATPEVEIYAEVERVLVTCK